MPALLERKLKHEYRSLPKKERDHAVFGTLNKIGAMHGSKVTKKGSSMDKALARKLKK